MNREPRPSDREIVAGLVERVTYQNADKDLIVRKLKRSRLAIQKRINILRKKREAVT
jgi:hypothetical protein